MERILNTVRLLCVLAVSLSALRADTLAGVEKRLDESAQTFKSMTAKVSRTTFTSVLNDKSTESGMMLMKRVKAGDTRFKIDLTEPDVKSVAFHNRKLESYLPKIKIVQEYDLGKQAALVDQFLLLGFGTAAKELAKSYNMKIARQEEIQGKPATVLELTPKTKAAAEQVAKVEMWFPDGQPYPVQQKIFQPSGDYYQITYSDLKWNAPLADDALELKLPKNVKREYPQK